MSSGQAGEACAGLADDIVKLFLDGALNPCGSPGEFNDSMQSRWAFTSDVELISGVAGPVLAAHPEGFRHSELLEAVVGRMAGERHAGIVLDPLVQALYDLGSNGFLIDLTPLAGPLGDFGYCLSGKPGREPLTAAYRGNVHGFGKLNFLSSLELEGDAEHGGRDALRSEYRFHGSVRNAGRWSESCIFHLRHLEGIPPLEGNPLHCSYYVSRRSCEQSADEMRALLCAEAPHFLGRNRLFVMGGAGEYREVRA